MADVQITVGLRREAGDDPRITFFRDVPGDDVADKIGRYRGAGVRVVGGHG
jgi:hypothetical protein